MALIGIMDAWEIAAAVSKSIDSQRAQEKTRRNAEAFRRNRAPVYIPRARGGPGGLPNIYTGPSSGYVPGKKNPLR